MQTDVRQQHVLNLAACAGKNKHARQARLEKQSASQLCTLCHFKYIFRFLYRFP